VPGVPTLSRLILRRDPVPAHRGQIPVNGPIWLIGADVHAIGDELRRSGLIVECHDWPAIPHPPTELGGLFLLPDRVDQTDSPCESLRWLRAIHEPLRRCCGLLRLVRSGDKCATSHAIGGLVKTARHEWPEVSCRIVDIHSTINIGALVNEILSEGPVETEITADGVMAPHLVSAPQPDAVSASNINAGALIVLTGGARGVTAEAAFALAHTYRPTLLLLGRTPAPTAEPGWLVHLSDGATIKKELIARAEQRPTPKQIDSEYRRIMADREINANLHRLRAAGAIVEYQSVDVRDTTAMTAVIAAARQKYGPVCGIVHGSGVLADKRIIDKTDEQFRTVYDTKVLGLESLLAATQADPLQFIALFSSSTGRFGRLGQCDYAAANEYLNATARRLQRERPDCRTVAINWGPWDGGMVTPSLRNVFAAEGVGLIPPEAGGQFLVAELSASDAPAEVVVLGPPPNQPAVFTLSHENIPALGDHVLDGKMVLPIALAIEYMAESAVRRFPDHRLMGCDDLRVLRPVQLTVDQPLTIHVHCDSATSRDGIQVVPIRLDANDRTCYRANVLLAPIPRMDRHVVSTAIGPIADCYQGELFHGPAWQGIVAMTSCQQSGIDIVARTAPPCGAWIRDGAIRHWHADPMVIDCVLQAIIVYTQRQFGLPSLPMAIGRLRILHELDPNTVNVSIRVTSTKLPTLRADVTVTDSSGRIIATLENCEYVCAESLRSSFANNRMSAEARR
jgi:NAD(P)-dependent dehydrogenase (short-subunit alcohol dehydrogenase family)